jgi:hypothetical protein
VSGFIFAPARGDVETPEQRRQRLEKMAAAEKEELIRKKERFEKLPPAEQERLRKFHEQVSTHPDSAKLRGVMVRYCDWLKTLTATQRGELESLPLDQRVPKIKELMKLQEEQRFKRLVQAPLPPEDLETIRAWIKDYATRNESMLMAKLSHSTQRWVREERDPERRLFRLRSALGRAGGGHFAAALAEEEEFKLLVSGLKSTEATRALEAAKEPEKKKLLVQEWLRAAVMVTFTAPATDEELEKFYTEVLDAEKREALDRLPREEMQKELRRLYNWHRFRRENPSPPGDPRGPGGRGSRPPG